MQHAGTVIAELGLSQKAGILLGIVDPKTTNYLRQKFAKKLLNPTLNYSLFLRQ